MKPVISYEITDGDRPGCFHLYRIVRRDDDEQRRLIDVRCCRQRLEEVAWLWRQRRLDQLLLGAANLLAR